MSKITIAARRERRAEIYREAAERIADPELIASKLSHLHPTQASAFLNLYRQNRVNMTLQEATTQRAIVGLFKDASDEVSAYVQHVASATAGEKWNLAQVKRSGLFARLIPAIDRRLVALNIGVKTTLQTGLVAQFKTAFVGNAHRFDQMKKIGDRVKTKEDASTTILGIDFDTPPIQAILAVLNEPWAGADFSTRLGLITDEMAQDIKSAITRSMISGESWQDTARSIRDEMGTEGTGAVWRAEMISRTELAHAMSLGNQAFEQANDDVIEDVIWVAHPGACAEICRDNDGESVDDVGRPPEDSHPNCVCDTMIVPKSSASIINGE